MQFKHSLIAMAMAGVLSGCGTAQPEKESMTEMKDSTSGAHPVWPVLDISVKKDPKVEAKVESILATMTVEQN